MIAFGCVSTDERRFRAAAATAIEAAAEPDSLLVRRHVPGAGGAEAYAEMISAAGEHDDLEALALVDQSVSRLDGEFVTRLRALLASSSDIAVIGLAPAGVAREVEWVGGPLVVLSAWASRQLRCDAEAGVALDPLAVDLSFQARAGGKRVVATSELGAASAGRPTWAPGERRAWLHGAVAVRRKWAVDVTPLSEAGTVARS